MKAALEQADVLWPNRRRDSDGTIGDAAHQATASDHNPDARGIVHAFDITASGVDVQDPNTPTGNFLVQSIIGRRDPRAAYVIWNRQIWRAYVNQGAPAWAPRPYMGSSPHTEHVHVSIWSDLNGAGAAQRDAAEADTSPWWTGAAHTTQEEQMASLSKGEGVMLPVRAGQGMLYIATDHGGTVKIAQFKDGTLAWDDEAIAIPALRKMPFGLLGGVTHVEVVSAIDTPTAVWVE